MADSKIGNDNALHVETATPRHVDPKDDCLSKAIKHADRAANLVNSGERPLLTEADSKRICRKTDRNILVVLMWVYFLQILDKSALGYGATFGLQEDNNLTGDQYSLVSSVSSIAQLAWQPFSSYLIVRVPHRILMPILCLGWGIAQACMAACHSFSGLMATRFFLGLFEAGCLPLFSLITSQWYRRAEQPMRVAAWYGTNGLGTIVAAGASVGLAHIQSDILRPWQIIFLFVGLLTIVSVPFIFLLLENDIPSARFLTEEEKPMAVERLRANQTGTGSREFKWEHVLEAVIEPKTWLFVAMSLLLNVGASVTNTFGPLILSGFGFDSYTTSLLNMPLGVMQILVILLSSYLAQKARVKGAICAGFMLPVVAGLAMLYTIPHQGNEAPLLVGYYFLAFLYGGNPLIISWIVGNTAGTTKKSFVASAYNAASSAGNIIGPLLFNSKDAPTYHPGLRDCLAIFVTLVAVLFMQWGNLVFLNKMQEKKRVQNGKPAKMVDHSMQQQYHDFEEDVVEAEAGPMQVPEEIGENAFLDLTDRKNDEFGKHCIVRAGTCKSVKIIPRNATNDQNIDIGETIQRYYRGYRTRRELKGWSLSSSTRWLEAVKEAQWHKSMANQYCAEPNGDVDVDVDSGNGNKDDIIQHGGAENKQQQQVNEEDNEVDSVRRESQTGHLSPEVRRKWKLARQVALRAGGDDNIHDKILEEERVQRTSSMVSASGGHSIHTFQQSTSRQKRGQPSIPTTTAADVEKTSKMMDLQYFLEMVDTKHRYGSNLRAYHSVWKNSPSKQNFFYWLDYGEGKDVELERVPRERLEREQVRYLSREERQDYLVVVDANGRFRWAKDGQRVWTDSDHFRDSIRGVVPVDNNTPSFRQYSEEGDELIGSSSSTSSDDSDDEASDDEVQRYVNPDFENAKGIKKIEYVSPAVIFNQLMQKSLKKKDKWIFVADTSFRIYIGIKESGAFQHSSFLRGARISAAGLIKIKNGQLRSLSPLSGHYRPPAANFRAFVHTLQNNGVDMSHVSISRSYAILVGIEGYMKFKQKKKVVKEKIEEEKKSKYLNHSPSSNEKTDGNGVRDGDDIPEISRSRPTQKKVGTTTTVNRVSTRESTEKQPDNGSGKKRTGLLSAITRKLSKRGSTQESKPVEIRGRGIPGTAPEEGVPAPEGHR
ncbi:hypothetical protein UA08_07716 [Talaromyces atroroseus]|uniref:Major facilitator superfamily (MFS) profile domain-containing protein n=1 Tax=Talaromyces atroroseus TaxID=1441469 RepID=A0A225APW7_TALAT|nr:hypothetical protein UA08_07716 [Talaromyces atroroseus]OKL56996.1 hypothetical protein UA08_07716 [Talaromyces atroroseus]